MNIGLYQSAASLTALERWQDAVTQNITSGQVTGFKKRTVEFSGTSMGQINAGEGRDSDVHSGVMPRASYGISFQSGETQPTGNKLDVAIQGEGFFQVENSAGERAYTRSGDFRIRPDRTITDTNGNTLLSGDGQPITLQAEGGEITISEDGSVKQGENILGKIGVVKFKDLSVLTAAAGGQFSAPKDVEPIPVENPVVLQGFLEASNVAPLREMVSLVQISRAYEANQKLITSRDQTLQRTLETLG